MRSKLAPLTAISIVTAEIMITNTGWGPVPHPGLQRYPSLHAQEGVSQMFHAISHNHGHASTHRSIPDGSGSNGG
jgi:hypothetical protein